MEESWRRKWKVVRKWNVPAYHSTMLTACVFVTRDTVRHPRRFVFGKFVRKPNCSWSEAFVNRGLTLRTDAWCPVVQFTGCKIYIIPPTVSSHPVLWSGCPVTWFIVIFVSYSNQTQGQATNTSYYPTLHITHFFPNHRDTACEGLVVSMVEVGKAWKLARRSSIWVLRTFERIILKWYCSLGVWICGVYRTILR